MTVRAADRVLRSIVLPSVAGSATDGILRPSRCRHAPSSTGTGKSGGSENPVSIAMTARLHVLVPRCRGHRAEASTSMTAFANASGASWGTL
jgi:hypothetical protein